jgi:signal transduction histidine kinase
VVWALVAVYLVASVLLTATEFVTLTSRERERIDAKMQAAGYALDQILGEDFHERYTPASPIAHGDYRRLVVQLNRFAHHLGVEYAYSMVRSGGIVYFVTSNETRDDTLRGTPSRFYNPYPSPPRALLDAFERDADDTRLFASYTNVWDSFYSVFIPRRTSGGVRYVLAADVKLEDRQTMLLGCALRSLLLVALLLFPLLPIVLSQRALLRSRDELAARKKAHIAELERANQRLEATVTSRTQELSQAVQELERFSYTVSHDLNTPLNAIAGFAQILREDAGPSLSPEHRSNLDRILAATTRMSALIKSLLTIAITQHVMPHKTEVDLSRLAEDVATELRSAGQAYGATISIQPGLRLFGDPSLLRLVVQNILSNACKYSMERSDAKVEVRGGTEGDRDWFSVDDNGVGFEPSQAKRLFHPFERHHADQFDGHGIGLSNVARIVDRHGGRITAEGRPGEGATFRVELPRA